jgi:hypothetical protein
VHLETHIHRLKVLCLLITYSNYIINLTPIYTPPIEKFYFFQELVLNTVKGKVVLLCSTEAHLGERRYSSYSFLTSALEGGEWSASRPARALPPGKEPPVPTVQEAGWAPEQVWMQRVEEKSSASIGDRTPAIQSIVRHCTDWTTLVPLNTVIKRKSLILAHANKTWPKNLQSLHLMIKLHKGWQGSIFAFHFINMIVTLMMKI